MAVAALGSTPPPAARRGSVTLRPSADGVRAAGAVLRRGNEGGSAVNRGGRRAESREPRASLATHTTANTHRGAARGLPVPTGVPLFAACCCLAACAAGDCACERGGRGRGGGLSQRQSAGGRSRHPRPHGAAPAPPADVARPSPGRCGAGGSEAAPGGRRLAGGTRLSGPPATPADADPSAPPPAGSDPAARSVASDPPPPPASGGCGAAAEAASAGGCGGGGAAAGCCVAPVSNGGFSCGCRLTPAGGGTRRPSMAAARSTRSASGCVTRVAPRWSTESG